MLEQATPIRAAQSQEDSLLALPKQFYLGFASSLGITKDITRTQAYSVWLQGMETLLSLLVQAVKSTGCKPALSEASCVITCYGSFLCVTSRNCSLWRNK